MLWLGASIAQSIQRQSLRKLVLSMSRRSHSASPPPPAKRPRIDQLTSEDFKNGVFLAPMVRSGACKSFVFLRGQYLTIDVTVPTRLFALKHGATLVWGPEMVDKAILHAERTVDRNSSHTRPNVYVY
jgi:tRNA-dihydrouridine synthase 2